MHSVNSQLTGLMKNLSRILVIIYLAAGCSKQINHKSSDTDQQITFGPKVFKDSGEYVYVTGTLTGEDVPNNTVVVTCEKQRMECVTCSVWQIGKNQIARLEAPSIYPVTKWDKNEIIAAESAGPFNCLKTTISIKPTSHSSGTLVWLEEPINQATAYCEEENNLARKAGLSGPRRRQFTVEDPPAWKRIQAQK